MKGFKNCENGHFFRDNLDSCPYCPKGSDNNKTQMNSGTSAPTMPATDNQTMLANDSGKTQIFGVNSSSNQSANNSTRDLNRTFIQEAPGDTSNISSNSAPRVQRKIVGWIITYDLDKMGLDYKIYEGNNTIGRDSVNTITINGDPAISSKHVTIMFRVDNKFYIKDEMAVNGTYLDGNLMDVDRPYELKDGQVFKLGNTTTFRFKSAV
jgi:pSer/pThr/pTyr-binding forkhead associated (FHA) protein